MTSNKLDLDIGHDLIDHGTSDDYYTPPYIFKALDLEFDLDVCAPPGGVPWIPAKRHYSVIDDGLSQNWEGRIWCNPPYSSPGIWIHRFIKHGNGICLVQSSRSKWWTELWEKADSLITLPSDHKFITGNGDSKSIFMPVILCAMGAENVKAFHRSKLSRVR